MTHRLVIITEIISPYRIPLFNALAQRPEVDLHVIFLAETDPVLRQWQVYKDEIKFSYQVLPSWRRRIGRYNTLFNVGMSRALRLARPNVIVCGGYNYIASWQALAWARIHRVPFCLWSESNLLERRRGRALVELVKAEFLRQCTGFVVPGRRAREYLLAHKIKEDVIFTAVNAVDNDLFASRAATARSIATELRIQLNLPSRYFLFTGRLVREKGVFELLAAYAKLDRSVREEMDLVFVGDGTSRPALEQLASSITPGTIRFVGFAQREQLPNYYALSEILILPTYSDTWGLVVNEGMACGLPIILSQAAGCADDLVTEGWNGHLIPAEDVDALAAAMHRLASQPANCAEMGIHSLKRVAEYSPDNWSKGMVGVAKFVGENHE
jgi:glycosyltransferase involved in cell wall biosynthesis